MEGQLENGKIVLIYLLFFFAINTFIATFYKCSKRDQTYLLGQCIEYSLNSVQSGDLIFRYGNGFFSKYFKEISDYDKVYSHVGIISIVQDSIFVIHSEASEFTGEGGVVKERVEKFISESSAIGMYRLNDNIETRCKIENEALTYLRKSISFDTKFDYNDSTSFYCTELVAHCINNALDCNFVQPNKYLGKSAIITLDNIYYNNPSFEKIQ